MGRVVRFRGAAAHLVDGGYATVLCNWAQRLDEPWHARVQGWVAHSGCDALVVRFSSTVPPAYALTWNGHLEEFDDVVERWVRYFAELGIEAIGDGGVILRKRRGDNWFRTLDVPDVRVGRCSEQLLELFAGVDAALDADEAMLRRPFVLSGDMQIVETTVPASGERTARLERPGGLGLVAGLDAPSLHLIRGCRPDLALAELLDDVAHTFGINRAEAVDIGLSVSGGCWGLGS